MWKRGSTEKFLHRLIPDDTTAVDGIQVMGGGGGEADRW